jgi:hypothetical protein
MIGLAECGLGIAVAGFFGARFDTDLYPGLGVMGIL